MQPGERRAGGGDELALVTALLQRVRREDPTAGLWEAGDLQWWWRRQRASDGVGQLFWIDDAGAPEAAVILTDWGRTWGCDPIVLPRRAGAMLPVVWARAMERIDSLALDSVEVRVRDDDAVLPALLVDSGFVATGERDATTWMRARDRPDVSRLAGGYKLHDRSEVPDRPHHLMARNGAQVAQRLSGTSLYRADLDLFIEAPQGEVAAYALFWSDPVTGVGLVEPMRTEEQYQRLGLARHLMTAGLERLANLGADRMKVSYDAGNPPARELYTGVGFQAESTSSVYGLRRG